MGIVHNPESEYSKECEKWNTPRRMGGKRPDSPEYFPAMLYKAHAKENGTIAVIDNPLAYREEIRQIDAEAFNRKCQFVVRDQYEKDRAVAQGWRETPAEALEAYEQAQIAIGDAAAERLYADQRMSAQAKAEAKAADEATHEHVGDVPAPKKAPRTKRITTV